MFTVRLRGALLRAPVVQGRLRHLQVVRASPWCMSRWRTRFPAEKQQTKLIRATRKKTSGVSAGGLGQILDAARRFGSDFSASLDGLKVAKVWGRVAHGSCRGASG